MSLDYGGPIMPRPISHAKCSQGPEFKTPALVAVLLLYQSYRYLHLQTGEIHMKLSVVHSDNYMAILVEK